MQSTERKIVVLGTGGTIAGTATDASDNVGYRAAQVGVEMLVRAVPPLAGQSIETRQVAQVDSKDMAHGIWHALAHEVARLIEDDDVAGIVITHGTDTLEETAYFLHRVLAPGKPVVLTAAMRPATSLQPDGPQNLLDAVVIAREPGAAGVMAVVAGDVHAANRVRKSHTYRLQAFDSGDAGPIARVEEGGVRRFAPWPRGEALGVARLGASAAMWPRVEVVFSHAGARGDLVDALVAQGVRGIVAAGTGNGTLHHALEAALERARSAGVAVMRSTRVAGGPVIDAPSARFAGAGELTPWQARVELMLALMTA
jgi:L-asparaginase